MARSSDVYNKGLTASQAEHLLTAANCAHEALQKLEALTLAIMNQTKDDQSGTLHQLAMLGNFHAMDQGNVADYMIEQLECGEID